MAAVGPTYGPGDPVSLLTKCTVQVTTGAADLLMTASFNAGYCRRVVPQAAGVLFLQRAGDAAMVSYACLASIPIDGEITAIGGTTNHATATSGLVLNLEL